MTLRRLPLYHRLLQKLIDQGRSFVSSPEIGSHLKLDPAQIRKDFEAAGIAGRPRLGYPVIEVVADIERFLGWDNVQEAFLAGVGNLGAALLGYKRFEACGLSIVAAFDTDPVKVGVRIRNKPVLPLEKLPDLARRMHIHMGVITTPAEAAQDVANRMVEGGIRAIWNFAPIRLSLPENVIVHNEDLYCSLASISKRLNEVKGPKGDELT